MHVSDLVVFTIDTRFITRKRADDEEDPSVAEATGAKCFEFVLGKELGDAFKNIQAAIENEYFLSYVPTAESRARIRVRADNLRVLQGNDKHLVRQLRCRCEAFQSEGRATLRRDYRLRIFSLSSARFALEGFAPAS